MKISEKTLYQIKSINNRLMKQGFDNIKVINAIAVDELAVSTRDMTVDELLAFVLDKTYTLQKKGIVKDNARSIGDK